MFLASFYRRQVVNIIEAMKILIKYSYLIYTQIKCWVPSKYNI